MPLAVVVGGGLTDRDFAAWRSAHQQPLPFFGFFFAMATSWDYAPGNSSMVPNFTRWMWQSTDTTAMLPA